MPHEVRKPQLQPLTVIAGSNSRPNKWRRSFLPIYILLRLIEWAVDMLRGVVTVIHKSIEDITLALESYINEPIQPQPSAKGGD